MILTSRQLVVQLGHTLPNEQLPSSILLQVYPNSPEGKDLILPQSEIYKNKFRLVQSEPIYPAIKQIKYLFLFLLLARQKNRIFQGPDKRTQIAALSCSTPERPSKRAPSTQLKFLWICVPPRSSTAALRGRTGLPWRRSRRAPGYTYFFAWEYCGPQPGECLKLISSW